MTSSSGVQGNSFLQAHHWELDASYRWLAAHPGDFFVGTARTPPPPALQPPGGHQIVVDVHTFNLGATYALSDRVRLSLTAPFQVGRISFIEDDHQRHSETSNGLGDVTLSGGAWLFNPRTNQGGNVMAGLGIKVPTGSYHDSVDFFTPTGIVQRPADPSIQRGDGGWGILLELQGFQRILPGALAYLSGSYLLNPRVRTDITIGRPGLPGNSVSATPYHLSVPDAYSVRAGVSYAILPQQGLALSLGGRIDGVPVQDLINGGDDNFRRPGYSGFVDTGLDLTRGSNTFTLNVPIRAHADRRANLYDRQVDIAGGGNLAKFEVLVSYTHRFGAGGASEEQ
jgi:hypothetical protein